jgi:hypothetical protein
VLLSLAQDLPNVWNAPSTDVRLKQKIVRILIQEIVANVDDNSKEIVLLIHWAGGRHSELRVKKSETGKHSNCTGLDAIEVMRQMAGQFPDGQIASTLKRLRMRTGADNRGMRIGITLCAIVSNYPPLMAMAAEMKSLLSKPQND